MTTIRVEYMKDSTMFDEVFTVDDGARVAFKVFDSGRGYVKLPTLNRQVFYARLERISVDGPINGGGS